MIRSAVTSLRDRSTPIDRNDPGLEDFDIDNCPHRTARESLHVWRLMPSQVLDKHGINNATDEGSLGSLHPSQI